MVDARVKVAVRVRPLVQYELEQRSTSICKISSLKSGGGNISVQSNQKSHSFDYDWVFPVTSSNIDIYKRVCSGLIDGIFRGFNATIFAYGQTGSGKTYTMGSVSATNILQEGIISLAVDDVFSKKEQIETAGGKVSVNLSYLEVYMEECYDLLAEEGSRPQLDVRELNGETVAEGLTARPIGNRDMLIRYLNVATKNRATGSTCMNAQSSRSHAICTLSLRIQEDTSSESSVVSKLHLVDLAGSERAQKTQATGERFDEGVSINKGLFALGNVIVALANKCSDTMGTSKIHIPYRDSKLTRLLKDALGGNGLTVMLACVSPADVNSEETVNTLRFASRASCIVNNARINVEESAPELEAALRDIAVLRQHNSTLQSALQESKRSYSKLLEVFPLQLRGMRHILTRCFEECVVVDDAEIELLRDNLKNILATRGKTIEPSSSSSSEDMHLDYVPPLFSLLEEIHAAEDALNENSSFSNHLSSSRTSDASTTSASDSTRSSINDDVFVSQYPSEVNDALAAYENFENEQINEDLEILSREKHCEAMLAITTDFESVIQSLKQEVEVLEIAKSDLMKQSNKMNEADDARMRIQEREKNRILESKKKEIQEKEKELQRVQRERTKALAELASMKEKAAELTKARVELMNKLKSECQSHQIDRKKFEHAEGQSKRLQSNAQREIAKLESQLVKKERVFKTQHEAMAAERNRLKELVFKQNEIKSIRSAKGLPKFDGPLSDDKAFELRDWITGQINEQVERTHLQELIDALSAKRIDCNNQLQIAREQGDESSIKLLEETLNQLANDFRTKQRHLQGLGVGSDKKRFAQILHISEARVLLNSLFDNHVAYATRTDAKHLKALGQIQSIKIQPALVDDTSEYCDSEVQTIYESDDDDYEESKIMKPKRKRSAENSTRNTSNINGSPKKLAKKMAEQPEQLTFSTVKYKLSSEGEKGLQDYTVKLLKEYLRARGLQVTGKKEELIDRIIKADQIQETAGDTITNDIVDVSSYRKTIGGTKRKVVHLDTNLLEYND